MFITFSPELYVCFPLEEDTDHHVNKQKHLK